MSIEKGPIADNSPKMRITSFLFFNSMGKLSDLRVAKLRERNFPFPDEKKQNQGTENE
jgi:hypothetical protein